MSKRGPKSLAPLDQMPEIVAKYAAGESALDLAPEHGVSSRTIYRWLLTSLGDEKYQDTITACLVNRIHDADQELAAAADSCQVSRAREIARFARMDFERRRPHLYGPKQELTHRGSAPALHISVVVDGAQQQNAPSEGNVINGVSQRVEDKG